MGRVSRNVGKDGETPEKATKVYWCRDCGGINTACTGSVVIGWIEENE